MNDPDRERRIYELNLQAANAAHERFYNAGSDLFRSVLGFADAALKAAAILNGGAAVATLAFIGALLTAGGAEVPRGYAALIDVLTAFGLGVLLSTLASGASYSAQFAYSHAHNEHELTWQHPYVHDTPKARSRNVLAMCLHTVAVLLVASSYAAFIAGGWEFREFARHSFDTSIEGSEVPSAADGGRDARQRPIRNSEQSMDASSANLTIAIGSILAAFVGPVAAVLITLRWESIRRSREERQTLLQTLLATRGRPADPSYSWAIRTTPLHFSRNRAVVLAHAAYMDAVRLRVAAEHQAAHDIEIGRRQGILISEMMKDLGYRGLTSEQIEAYTAQGLADREELFQRALESLPHIALSAKRSADAAEAMLAHLRAQGGGGAVV